MNGAENQAVCLVEIWGEKGGASPALQLDSSLEDSDLEACIQQQPGGAQPCDSGAYHTHVGGQLIEVGHCAVLSTPDSANGGLLQKRSRWVSRVFGSGPFPGEGRNRGFCALRQEGWAVHPARLGPDQA